MGLLNKLQYKQLLSAGASQKRTATDAQWQQVLNYAAKQFPKLQLTPRNLTNKDASVVYQFGQKSLFHVRAFPRKLPDTFVIVVTDDKDKPTDHILIDLAAEYGENQLEGPQFGLIESATAEDSSQTSINSSRYRCNDLLCVWQRRMARDARLATH